MEASRRFFKRGLEQLIIRQLAVGMQCIPSDVDVFRLTEEQRVTLLVGRDDNEFLKDAFWEENGDRYVRGTQKIPFPNNGPTCNYTALFDKRREFDPLRLSFLTYGDEQSRIHACLRRLQSLVEEDTEGSLALCVEDIDFFLERARCWSTLQCPTIETPGFARLNV